MGLWGYGFVGFIGFLGITYRASKVYGVQRVCGFQCLRVVGQ